MKRISLRRIALTSGAVVFLAAMPAFTSRHPQYGGTLLVEMGATIDSLNTSFVPAQPKEFRAQQQIDQLIYDHRNRDGTFSDPGPFRLVEWEPGKHAVLTANEQYPRGRPFVESIEIQMGRPANERLIDVELNKADVAEIPPDQARRAAERGVRISASKPDQLIAVVFVRRDKQTGESLARLALSRAIDRAAIVNFILQKEGEPAGGLLPQWSSGTAFLFSTARDLDRANELRSQIPASAKIGLGYDAGDPQLQAIGERIAVNAREAGITITTEAIRKEGPASKTAARLERFEMPSPHPRASLVSFLDRLQAIAPLDSAGDELPDPATPQQIYDREASVIQSSFVIPIAWVPHVYGLSSRLRNWNAPAPGDGWPLADVWLDQTASPPERETP